MLSAPGSEPAPEALDLPDMMGDNLVGVNETLDKRKRYFIVK